MNNSMKLALAALLVAGATNVFAVGEPTTLDALATQAKAAGYNSEGELYGVCDPYCKTGKDALPSKIWGASKQKQAAQCATYCKVKAPFFEKPGYYQDSKKAEKYREAANVLSDYAKKNKIEGFVPEKK